MLLQLTYNVHKRHEFIYVIHNLYKLNQCMHMHVKRFKRFITRTSMFGIKLDEYIYKRIQVLLL